MDDLISRSKLLDTIDQNARFYGLTSANKLNFMDIVRRQETVYAEPKWISVKDGSPEDDNNLSFYDDGQLRFTSVLVHDEKRGTAIANRLMIRHHSIPSLDELATDGWVWSRPHEPTHWMPLPEPPKEY